LQKNPQRLFAYPACIHILKQLLEQLTQDKQSQAKTLMQSSMNFGYVETATSLPREKIFMLNYLISLQSPLLCNDAKLIHQLFLAADSYGGIATEAEWKEGGQAKQLGMCT
jgi:hypothetical protein